MSDATLTTTRFKAVNSSAGCRRMSLLTTVKPIPDENGHVDAARAAVESKAPTHAIGGTRRASLDVNIEYAVAMVNEDSSLDDDDRFMCAFGTRRDSVCGPASPKHGRRRILKKKETEEEEAKEC